MKFYENTLPQSTAKVVDIIKNFPQLHNFYLTGGTALSLQLGHRESEDLDFFTQETFDPQLLQRQLQSFGELDNVQIAEGTLNLYLQNVKLQFLYYPYKLLEKTTQWNEIALSSVIDIACTKLITISMRGSKKDFIDLYFILKNYSLDELLEGLDKKYQGVNYNHAYILKSLVYFEDANSQPMPRMHMTVEWDKVRELIIDNVKAFRL